MNVELNWKWKQTWFFTCSQQHIHLQSNTEATGVSSRTDPAPKSHLLLSCLYLNKQKKKTPAGKISGRISLMRLSGVELNETKKKKVVKVWVTEVQVWHHQGVLWVHTLFWERGGKMTKSRHLTRLWGGEMRDRREERGAREGGGRQKQSLLTCDID